MRTIEYIVIHCSATGEDKDIGVAEIDAMHKKKGWRMIGYHDVIRRDGRLEKGRPIEERGAHVKGFNDHSIGICIVGGIDADDAKLAEFNYTRAQIESLNRLLDSYKAEFPDAKIMGHKDFPNVNKACPCFDVISYTN